MLAVHNKKEMALKGRICQNRPMYAFGKRTLDIVLSSIGLVCLSPIFLIVGILIKIDDPKAPIFYTQIRVGVVGKKFRIYKFRTMKPNAEAEKKALKAYNEIDGAMFKMEDDPRVTKIGRYLREHSIDEFPQLLNVLKGDMSLVGPRPPLPSEVALYNARDKQRLLVTPGCTGLWQVSGRNALDFKEMVNLDIKYINHSSLGNDFKIIFKTVAIIFKPNDAF